MAAIFLGSWCDTETWKCVCIWIIPCQWIDCSLSLPRRITLWERLIPLTARSGITRFWKECDKDKYGFCTWSSQKTWWVDKYQNIFGISLWLITDQEPVSLGTSGCTSSLMRISFCSHPKFDEWIATKFCTCHDNRAVMACAKICCNLITRSRTTPNLIFHKIWIVGRNCWWNGPQLVYPMQDYIIMWDTVWLICKIISIRCITGRVYSSTNPKIISSY